MSSLSLPGNYSTAPTMPHAELDNIITTHNEAVEKRSQVRSKSTKIASVVVTVGAIALAIFASPVVGLIAAAAIVGLTVFVYKRKTKDFSETIKGAETAI